MGNDYPKMELFATSHVQPLELSMDAFVRWFNGLVARLTPLRIAAGYALLSAAWVLFNDLLLHNPQENVSHLLWHTVSDWLFVLLTALLLYSVLRSYRSALRDKEYLYSEFFESAPFPMLLIDPVDMSIHRANHKAHVFYGFPGRDLERKRISEINQLHSDEVRRKIDKASSNEETRFRFRHRLADGRVRDVDVSSGPLDLGGRQLLLSVVRDVTDSLEERRQLSRVEALLHGLLENMPAAVSLVSPTGEVLLVNPYWEEITGIGAGRAVGANLADLYRPEVAGPVLEINRRALETGEVVRSELPAAFLRAYTFQVLRFPVHDGEGRLQGVGGISIDITQLKRKEWELAKANEAKNIFLSNMSHELRTPLSGIMGVTDLLLNTNPSPERRAEYLRLVREASQTLLRQVQDMLQLSEFSGQTRMVRMRRFKLAEVYRSLSDSTHSRARRKGLDFVSRLDPALVQIWRGDDLMLRQLASCLLDNALRFTPQGRVELEVGPAVHVDGCRPGHAWLQIIVRDTGIGIPEERQERVFESFVICEDVLSKKLGGAGIGLSVAREIARSLGGDVAVESTPGEGSTFRAWVCMEPLLTGTDVVESRVPVADVAPGLRVLVVEDERVNRLFLRHLLEYDGHAVVEAGNGREALEALRHEPVDVVLMDVQMPVMDGVSATAHIRSGAAGDDCARVPIIAVTAFTTEADRRKVLDAGMNRFLAKPLGADDLRAAIRETVVRRQ